MPTTSLGLVYPASTDNVQIWQHMQTLASGVDALIAADRAAMAAQSLFAVKAGDEPVTSSTTLQNDDHLLLTYAANTTYTLSGHLYVFGDVGGDLKIGWTFTEATGTRFSWSGPGPDESVSTYTGIGIWFPRYASTTSPTGTITFGTSVASNCDVGLSGILVAGSTGGTLRMQWAQGTSSGTATVVKKDSWICLEKRA